MAEHCAKPFVVEAVKVVTDGQAVMYPDLSLRREKIEVALMNKRIGIQRTAAELAQMLTKMQLPSTAAPDGQSLTVTVPPVRPDVLHAYVNLQ